MELQGGRGKKFKGKWKMVRRSAESKKMWKCEC
jgi:hypothetical protein